MIGDSPLYLGLGKTLFNSSACLFRNDLDIELILSERILRKKATGVWPEHAIRLLGLDEEAPARIAENRDVHPPTFQEDRLNQTFPFYDYLSREGLGRYSRRFNPEIEFVTHHRCHAMAAVALSPFDSCVIVVMDGAGSLRKDFNSATAQSELIGVMNEGLPQARPTGPAVAANDYHEECSVYLHDRGALRCVYKRWRVFERSPLHSEHTFSDGVGILYEKTAEYVFNSGRAAGKVMGLAAFGKPSPIRGSRRDFLEGLDWRGGAFKGKTKAEWAESGRFAQYADLAASVQQEFETGLLGLLGKIRGDFPGYGKLILTGGCALNCTANMKALEKGLFEEIYVPPFPGDESIGFGAASHLYHSDAKTVWRRIDPERQHGYFGPRGSVPTEAAVARAFTGCAITRPASIAEHAASLLAGGKILGWFQGRSESGPRALGNRSILADPRIAGLKDRLNREIKRREEFRPYGASCTHEAASGYFEVPAGFNSPYMSFAVRPRAQHRELLGEVCHVDGTSRIQTVRKGQNPVFHALLSAFGARTGLPCLLNTSLNVMGEPIIETVEDARRFLESTPVDGIAVGGFYVSREPSPRPSR